MANKISVLIDVTVDKANTAINNFRKSVGEADGAVGKFKAGAASLGASLKANMVPAATVAGAAAIKFGKDAIAAASDLAESTNAVEKAFGSAAESVLEIGENSAESFGLSKSAFNDAAVGFAAFTEKIAGPGGDVAATLDDLIGRSADFASVMNLEVSEAADVFRAALSGEQEAIKRYGIDMSAAAVEAYAMAEGLVENKTEMTELIKVQARYGLLMEETTKFAGDFADTSDGLANSSRILNARLTDLTAMVGAELIPEVEDTVGVLLLMSDALEVVGLAAKGVSEEEGGIKGFLNTVGSEFKKAVNPVDGLRENLAKAQETFSDMAGGADEATEAIGRNVGAMVSEAAELYRAEVARKAYVVQEELAIAVAEKQAEADEAAAEATRDAADAALEAADALNERTDAARSAVDATYALHDAEDDFVDALEESNATLNDQEADLRDVRQALDNAGEAAQKVADAQVAVAEETAKANGETLSATQRLDIMNSSMLTSAASANGPLRNAILNHIAAVNGIPEEKMTEIEAAIASGDIDAAETALNDVSRTRTSTVDADANTWDAENKLNWLARDRRTRIYVEQPSNSTIGGVRSHSGGIVPGSPGEEVPMTLQAGEMVVPGWKAGAIAGGSSGGGTVNITVNALDPAAASRAVIEAIKQHERRNGPGWRS